MEVWKMTFLLNWVIFRFHVDFAGCKGHDLIHWKLLQLTKLYDKNELPAFRDVTSEVLQLLWVYSQSMETSQYMEKRQ